MVNPLAERSRAFLQKEAIHSQWQSDYLNSDMDSFYDLAFADIIKRIGAKPGDIVLDAGCGYGYHTVRLARSGATITAIDFSEPALNEARSTIAEAEIQDRVNLEQADLTVLPFSPESFNYIVCWGVLMHIPNLEAALAELTRVLKPQGYLVLCENNMHSPDIAIRERAIHLFNKLFRGSHAERRITPRGIEMWEGNTTEGLMVRKANIEFIVDFLSVAGMQPMARTAGQFSEVYTNLPFKSWKRAVYAFNRFYFQVGWTPKLAVTNVLYFKKTRK